MRRMWAVCRREFLSYFITPIGYIVTGTYAAITGMGFLAAFIYYARVSQNPAAFEYSAVPDLEETMLSPYLVFCGQILLFLGPLLTMRLLAEERNKGTMELLFTYPLRDRDIVFGKYFAALGVMLVMMGSVAVHLAVVSRYASVEPAVLVFGLLTVFLMGAAFIAIGMFVSALTSSQVTSATVTFGIFFVSFVLGSMGKDMAEAVVLPETIPAFLRDFIGMAYTVLVKLVRELPLDAHAREMAQGIVAPRDIAYYLLVTALFLFLTFRALDARRWKGGV
jgi:ABC-2 type transport system permease protein